MGQGAQREAEGKSVLAHLATRQTMLYGTRAINYVDDPGGGTRRLDNRLKTISYTADNAMGWVLIQSASTACSGSSGRSGTRNETHNS